MTCESSNAQRCVPARRLILNRRHVTARPLDQTSRLRAGLGFEKYPFGWIEYFLSCGSPAVERCERYKKNPALAKKFIEEVPNALIEKLPPRKKFLLFEPLALVEDETPEVIIFLANAEQISGLVTLANYDSPTPDAVKILFGAGCAQIFLYPFADKNSCYVGLTDPSARKFIDKNLLAFSLSYEKFLHLEACAAESFLTAEAWQKIARRQRDGNVTLHPVGVHHNVTITVAHC